MRCTMLILGTALLAALPALGSAEPALTTGNNVISPVQANASTRPLPGERLDASALRYGPILAKDSATRDRIKSLYREQWDLQQSMPTQLRDLGARARTLTGTAALAALNREGMQLKFDFERRNMELGLEIARLNGDSPRVAEYELALDQLLHPEKYQPVLKPDPEVQARRARERGTAK